MSESAQPSSSTPTYPPGNVAALLDRYQVLGIIGQGGMGTVYKGFHLSLKRFVAIKVLRLDKNNSPELVSRFLREMQAIGQMDHPNVVRATDGGEKNGLFFLVMEYLEGADLSRLVVRRGRLETADACELVRQAAVGLDYVHQTLVHRDVKPSNLILTPAGLVKILDLGLARLHEIDMADRERTPEGCALGTYDYMAPEQASGSGRVDGRTDEYSLGCTLFKLLTGHAPFAGPQYDNVARKLYAHGHVPLTAVAEFPSIPEGLRPVLLRMTAKDPAERYPTAGDVARALAPFAAGSQPLLLLGGADDLADTVLQPLPVPLPAELSRLTGARTETLSSTPPAPPMQLPPRHRAWLPLLVGVGVLACVPTAIWFLAPALFPRSAETSPTYLVEPSKPAEKPFDLRLLDDLPAAGHHPLLDQMPIPAGWDGGDAPPAGWQWDKGPRLLKVTSPDIHFFKLGTTARTRFTIQAGITQAPWSGNFGIFWGYHEDAAAQKAKKPDATFASFQMAGLEHLIDDKGSDRFSVLRGLGQLSYDRFGEVRFSRQWQSKHGILPPTAGENVLVIAVFQERLGLARFGSEQLTGIYSAEANTAAEPEPYSGTLGVFTAGYHATFANVEFMAESNK